MSALIFLLVSASSSNNTAEAARLTSRVVDLQEFPFEVRTTVVGNFVYATESGGEVICIDGAGVVKARRDISISKKQQFVSGIFPAGKGDLYAVIEERHSDNGQTLAANQKVAVMRLSHDLKKKWVIERTFEKPSDSFAAYSAAVGKDGAISVAFGPQQKMLRINANGKLAWEVALPVKGISEGLFVADDNSARFATTPIGQPSRAVKFIEVSKNGTIAGDHFVGPTFTDRLARLQVGPRVYLSANTASGPRLTCLDLATGKADWDTGVAEPGEMDDVKIAARETGDVFLAFKRNSNPVLQGYSAQGARTFETKRNQPFSRLTWTKAGLAGTYTYPGSAERTCFELIDENGKTQQTYGLDTVGGIPTISEVENRFIIANLGFVHSFANSREGNSVRVPVLWVLEPNTK